MKTDKEKLRPTPRQERALEAVLWRCRPLDNTALEQRQRSTAWQRRRISVSVSRFEQDAELKAIRAAFPEYAVLHSHALHEVLARLDRTFQACFRRVQAGERPGFPRFKGRYGNCYHAFTFTEDGNGARLDNGHLVLAKLGHLGVHGSRLVEAIAAIAGTPRTVTISKEAAGWDVSVSVSVSCAAVPAPPRAPTGQETGIDLGLGLESFATLSDGTRILTPGYYRNAERYLAKCQRQVSRRKQGSQRWRRKAVCWLAKAQQRVRRRQRQDFHHKTALALVCHYDTRSHEALQVRNLLKHHHLAKSIADAGWRAFLALLSCKAARLQGCKAAHAGRAVHAVDPAYTRQACAGCGVVVQKGLCLRWHECPACGTSLQRDHNAAKTIVWRGQRLRGLAGKPAGTRGEACGDSRGSLRE